MLAREQQHRAQPHPWGAQSQQAPSSVAEPRAMDGAPPCGVVPGAASAAMGAAHAVQARPASPVLLSRLSSEVVLGALTKDALHLLLAEACTPPAASGSGLCTPPAGSQQGVSLIKP